MPGGSAGLELMAGNDRAAILDERVRNRFAVTVGAPGFLDRFAIRRKPLIVLASAPGPEPGTP